MMDLKQVKLLTKNYGVKDNSKRSTKNNGGRRTSQIFRQRMMRSQGEIGDEKVMAVLRQAK